ncbi:energy-coupled thiamine transporter ThiT [Pradoshia eiseniae]|uniref:Energy-coupled thiamine transporter ThiT n=2 Tax=Pradoshia eiseniae TaxID=2064768 RepID=A0A2S7N0M4_9BACI|nr:energy-coupled thiamine transporter ThiT [Pradoshia eiseniae]PQD95594.1 energy-coupled thiamine transporter ThiT [Pradoshia eiseniae]
MRNNRLLYLVEVAIFAAMAFIFDLLGNIMSFSLWAQGGSVSIAMVPVFLMALRWGVKGGVVTGLLLGLLQIVSGTAYILTPVQGILDYIVAFSAVGLSGLLFSLVQPNGNNRRTNILYVIGGILVGSSLRFLAHFIAGVVFFGAGAADGQSVIIFSLLYNLSYLLPSVIVSGGVIMLLFSSAPRLLLKKAAHY